MASALKNPSSSRNIPLDYRRRHLLWVGLAVLSLNLIALLLSEVFILSSFRDLEEERIREHADRAVNTLAREGEFLRRMVVDEAFWDKAYAFAADPGSNDMTGDMTAETLEEGRLSAIIMTDAEGRILFSCGYDLDAGSESSVAPVLLENLFPIQKRLTEGEIGSVQVGLLFARPYPFQVAAAPILKSDGTGPGRGMLLYARELNPGRIDKLGELIQLDLGIDSEKNLQTADSGVAVRRQGGTISAHVNLPDLLGRPGGALDVTIDRLIYSRGRASVRYFLCWTLGSSLLFALLAIWLLNRVSRLDARRAERDRLVRNLLERSGEAIFLIGMTDGRVLEANPRGRELFPLKEKAPRAENVFRTPEGNPFWEELSGQVREGLGNFSAELQNRSGQALWCEGSATQVSGEEDHYLLLQIRDVSTQKAAEDALKASAERYRQLFENSPLPMWVVDMENLRYLDVNQTALETYGYSREEFLAMPVLNPRPAGDGTRFPEVVSREKGGEDSVGPWPHRCKDGRILDMEIVRKEIPFADRSALLVMAEDMTEKESLRREADQVSRLAALGELAAGVAHEINNPNGMILRNLDFIGDILSDALPLLEKEGEAGLQLGGLDFSQVRTEVPQLIDDMQQGAGHIRDIVRDMKDFVRLDDPSDDGPLDLNEAVATAVRLLDGPIRKATDAFELQLGDDLPPGVGSSRQIGQVVLNLVMNACQSLPDRSRGILVRTRFDPAKKRILAEVIDQGRGVAKEDLERLTDPFFTTRREQGGTGLGLSVSARIVKQHRGTLSFQTEPGKGTQVTLALPVA
ncbi:PAS/PAC sensor signal transduction histidine kinase [Desulfuromonas soudanensis]|uniref:histidine kinase n=1 Tax=Desulfuromonas soudanensis TaxID=1603606 RepID=A0A0M5IQS8_9BACT|nr:PAS domain S-box protein [Desulfuromonas soudanensis]ALC15468.1 PAS/PAC sensor signal transduction histidine kinase [Desulfuromonas soudanensis]